MWTPQAELSYIEVISFVIDNQSSSYANKIIDTVIENETLLSKHPFIGSLVSNFPEKQLRKLRILNHFSLIYRVFDNNTIDIIYFWDNRQDNKNLEKL